MELSDALKRISELGEQIAELEEFNRETVMALFLLENFLEGIYEELKDFSRKNGLSPPPPIPPRRTRKLSIDEVKQMGIDIDLVG